MVTANPEPSLAPRRLGVLGGTFDPIHLGHLIIAEEARARLALDQVLFVPAHVSPFKLRGSYASPEDRYCMVALAIADNPSFHVSRADLDRAGPSFTVDTLRTLKAEYGGATTFYFIIGADALGPIASWREPREILRLTRFIAITRPGFALDLAALEGRMPGIAALTDVVDTLSLGISSTDIRRRLHAGLPIRYQVPMTVESYIREHHLYA